MLKMEINRNVVDEYNDLTAADIAQFDTYTLVAFINAISKSWLEQEAEIKRLKHLLRDWINEETHDWEN